MTDPDDGTIPWRALRDEAVERLAAAGVTDHPGSEARWLVEEASGFEGGEYVAGLDRPVTERCVVRFDAMLTRRLAGEPLQYVLGRWAFRRLDLMVDARVLIPRPETEILVDVALAEVDRATTGGPVRVVDLGTGSGAIGLSIAVERVTADVWLTDVSGDALAVARANLAGIGRPAQRVTVAEGSWFAALPAALRGSLDVVVANPPYVADDDPLPAVVAEHEPVGALRSGPDGLDALREIVAAAPPWLGPGGALVVELDPVQAPTVAALARAEGFAEAEIRPDLSGRDRVVVARAPS